MARVPYIEYDDASDELRDLYDSATRITGRVTNLHKIMGHVPWLYRWYLPLQMSAQRSGIGLLDHRTKTLAHVKTSLTNGCQYCSEHTSNLGIEAGVLTDPELEAMRGDYRTSGLFSDRDLAVLGWAEAVASNTARREMDLFAALREHFSDSQIVELTMVIAIRSVANRVVDSLWGELEDDSFPTNKRTRLSHEALIEHCDVVAKQLHSELAEQSGRADTHPSSSA